MTMRTAPTPMLVHQIEEPGEVKCIFEGWCMNCWDPVPAGTEHPNPCMKPPMCRRCCQAGHIERHCCRPRSSPPASNNSTEGKARTVEAKEGEDKAAFA